MGRNSTNRILNIHAKNGFTLQELMVAVAVLGILFGIAIPKFGGLLRNSREGEVKTKLGILRSSLNIYYSENMARFPRGSTGNNQTTLATTLVPKYIKTFPEVYVYPHHAATNTVDNTANKDFQTADPTDDGEWAYVSDQNNNDWGFVAVECYHTDSKSQKWSSY